MKLNYKLIIEATQALNGFNPPSGIPWKAQFRLDRNLRKLNNAGGDFELFRNRAQWSVKKDQTKASNRPDGSAELTPEEHLAFSEKLAKLFIEEAEVEIFPVELIDTDDSQLPTDEEHFVDVHALKNANYPLSRAVRSTLTEAGVFEQWKGKTK